jgi:Amt family ammonium transporter
MTIEWVQRRKPSGIGIASGAVAGLAAITPASGYVPTWASLVIGGGAGLLCYLAVRLKDHLRYDDALDVVGVHMVGGFVGVVLTGVFASLAVNALGASGGIVQLGRETVLALAALIFPFVMTFIILWIVDKTVGLRVSVADQDAGLDKSEHAEVGYDWLLESSEGVKAPTNNDLSITDAAAEQHDT